VEHFKEDTTLQVNTVVDDLCEKDSNRQIFSFMIVEPPNTSLSTYTCGVSKTSHPNVNLIMKMYNNTYYSVHLPPFSLNQESFFNLTVTRNLVVEILCSNENFVTHKRTVDLKICAKLVKISDIALQNSTISEEKQLTIKFNAKVKQSIARLKAVDVLEKPPDSYVFTLAAPNEFIDVKIKI
jgi:hypothetical protein